MIFLSQGHLLTEKVRNVLKDFVHETEGGVVTYAYSTAFQNLLTDIETRAVRRQKKSRQKRRLVQAPQAPFKAAIHSKCCIGGFRETGLALVIVLRCD